MASDDYLEEVRGEGKLVSSGSFTVDREGMLAKLGKHQLPGPDYYVLKLVQAAVAGGATFIRFRTSGAGKEITFDGKPWEAHELARLGDYVLAAAPEQRHLFHLAVGMQGLLALSPSRWELCSPRGRVGVPSGPGEVLANTLRVGWGRGAGKVAAGLAMRFFWEGRRLLFKRAKYAPIAITLDTSYVNRHAGVLSLRRTFGHSICPVLMPPDTDATDFTYVVPTEEPGEVMGPAMSLCSGVSWVQGELLQRETWNTVLSVSDEDPKFGTSRMRQVVELPSQSLPGIIYGDRRALGCSALIQRAPITGQWGSRLTLIHDGVALDGERLRDLPGYKLWVSARGLGVDLSHFKVIRDERYQRLVEALGQLLRVLQERNFPP